MTKIEITGKDLRRLEKIENPNSNGENERNARERYGGVCWFEETNCIERNRNNNCEREARERH